MAATKSHAFAFALCVLVAAYIASNPNGIPDDFELFAREAPPITIKMCNDDTLKLAKVYVKGMQLGLGFLASRPGGC
jgi:hypothetical protein